MFCTFTLALSIVCSAQYGWFCSSLISCFLVTLLRYCLGDCQMFPVAPIIAGITLAFAFHMRWISVMKSLYFKIFSASFLITFLPPGTATTINKHVPCLLSRNMMPGLLLGKVLSVRTCRLHNTVALPSCLVSTDFSTRSYLCLLSNFTPISLHMLKRS